MMAHRPYQRNDPVAYLDKGQEVNGTIVKGRQCFYPQSTVTKYGNGSLGPIAYGYKIRGPIIQADGSFYMVRGEVAHGIKFVDERDVLP
jgi:hypothetical protein